MPDITVTDAGYSIEQRQYATEVRYPSAVGGGLIGYAVPPGPGLDGVWTVTVAPAVIEGHAIDGLDDDWPSFDVRTRGQADNLLKLIAHLYGQRGDA